MRSNPESVSNVRTAAMVIAMIMAICGSAIFIGSWFECVGSKGEDKRWTGKDCEVLGTCKLDPCGDQKQCAAAALVAYQEATKKASSEDLSSLFDSARAFEIARVYTQQAGKKATLTDVDSQAATARRALDAQFRQQRFAFQEIQRSGNTAKQKAFMDDLALFYPRNDSTYRQWVNEQASLVGN